MKQVKKMIIFANLKIFMRSMSQVREYVEDFKRNIKTIDTGIVDIHIMADFLSFDYMKKNLSPLGIKVGVQDIFWEDHGAFTGEIAPALLRDLGCDSVFIGHSVRKSLVHETDETINLKVHAALRNNITPFMFIGETKEELKAGLTEQVLNRQIEKCLYAVTADMISKVVIVFEPRWAIGQSDSASTDMIRQMHLKVRKMVENIYGANINPDEVCLIYGGGVNLENICDIVKIPEVDGAGAARASVDALHFLKLIKIIETEAKKRRSLAGN
jgi:triosephosphate isomerase (TIM)